MTLNPNRKFEIEAERQRHKHQRDMQLAWDVEQSVAVHPSSHRGRWTRLFYFLMTFIISSVVFGVLLGSVGFIVTALVSNSPEGELIGVSIGAILTLLLSFVTSMRAADA